MHACNLHCITGVVRRGVAVNILNKLPKTSATSLWLSLFLTLLTYIPYNTLALFTIWLNPFLGVLLDLLHSQLAHIESAPRGHGDE